MWLQHTVHSTTWPALCKGNQTEFQDIVEVPTGAFSHPQRFKQVEGNQTEKMATGVEILDTLQYRGYAAMTILLLLIVAIWLLEYS